MTHSYLLIIAEGSANSEVFQILEVQNDIQISIIESNQPYQFGLKNINRINETAAFYQPWRNSLVTLEVNIYSYDYLFLVFPNNISHFIRQSLLTDRYGSININRKTLQHKIYNNVFAVDHLLENDPGGKENKLNRQISLLIRSLIKNLLRYHYYLLSWLRK